MQDNYRPLKNRPLKSLFDTSSPDYVPTPPQISKAYQALGRLDQSQLALKLGHSKPSEGLTYHSFIDYANGEYGILAKNKQGEVVERHNEAAW